MVPRSYISFHLVIFFGYFLSFRVFSPRICRNPAAAHMEAEAAAFLHGPRPGGGFGLQFLAISKSPLRPPVIFRQTLTPVPIFSDNLSSSFHISLRPSSTTKPGARPRWWHVVWLMLLSDLQLVDKLCQLRPMFRRFVSRSLRVERRMAAWVSRSGGIEQSLQPHLVSLRFLQNKHIFVRCSFHCQETFIWSFFSSLLFQVSPLNDSAFSWFSTHVVLLFWLHPTWFSFSLSTTSLGDALFEASRTVKNQGGSVTPQKHLSQWWGPLPWNWNVTSADPEKCRGTPVLHTELPCSKTVQRCWPTYRGLRSIPFLDLFRSSLYVHALELLDEMSQNSQNSSNTFKDSKILFKSTFQRGEIQIEVQPDPECSNMLKWWRVPARMQK